MLHEINQISLWQTDMMLVNTIALIQIIESMYAVRCLKKYGFMYQLYWDGNIYALIICKFNSDFLFLNSKLYLRFIIICYRINLLIKDILKYPFDEHSLYIRIGNFID